MTVQAWTRLQLREQHGNGRGCNLRLKEHHGNTSTPPPPKDTDALDERIYNRDLLHVAETNATFCKGETQKDKANTSSSSAVTSAPRHKRAFVAGTPATRS